MTFVAGAASRAEGAQMTITALVDENKSLTQQLNNNQPTAQNVSAPAVDSNSATLVPANPTPGSSGTFADLTMSKQIDGSGCAINKTDTFSATDAKIYVVATIKNYKAGTTFSSVWGGGSIPTNTHFDWKAPQDGAQICVQFFIQPKVLGLKAGSYNVAFSSSAPDGTTNTQSLQFTLQ